MMMRENTENLPAYEFIAREQRSEGRRAALEEALVRLNEELDLANAGIYDDYDAGFYRGIDTCIERVRSMLKDA